MIFEGNSKANTNRASRALILSVISFFIVFLILAPNAEAALLRPGSSSGLVGWWKFDDNRGTTAMDSSGKGNLGTLSGSTNPTWVPGKRGSALSFDGSSGYVSLSDNAALSPQSGNFTVSAWIKTSTTFSGNSFIYSDYGVATLASIQLYINSSNQITGDYRDNSGNLIRASGPTLSDSKWHFVVWVKNSQTGYLYVDNQAPVTNTNGSIGSIVTNTAFPPFIGKFGNGISNFFSGLIDDVRIYNRALTAAEILSMYKSGEATINQIQPVRLNQGLVGYWSFDGKTIVNGHVNDLSGNGNTGYPTNISTSTFYAIGKIGQGGRFDGVNDVIKVPNAPMPTGPFTLAIWAKKNNNNNTEAFLGKNASGQTGVALSNGAGNNVGYIYNSRQQNTTSGIFTAGSWHHETLTWDGATVLIYIDGVQQITYATTTAPISNSSVFVIGANTGGAASFFSGQLDDGRYYNRALSPNEVKALYQLGQATIDKSRPDRLKNGLVGYWTFDGKDMPSGRAADVSGNSNTGYLLNMSTSTSRAIGKIGQGLKFDGVDDHVTAPSTPNISSVALWAKITQCSGNQIIFKQRSGSTNRKGLGIKGSLMGAIMYDGTYTTAYGSCSLGWHHLVLTSDGTNRSSLKGYNDGVEVSTIGTEVLIFNQSDTLIGSDGPSGGDEFTGLIDDVRIYDRALTAAEVRQLYNLGR